VGLINQILMMLTKRGLDESNPYKEETKRNR